MPDPVKITREYLLKIGGWSVLKEAEILCNTGKVESVTYDPPFLQGRVKTATSSVQARIKLSDRLFEIENLCSCRQAQTQGTICPHVLALGLKYLIPAAPTPTSLPETTPQTQPVVSPRPSRFTSSLDGTPSLSLLFLLPLEFAQSWQSGKIRVIVEATVDQTPSRPLDTVLCKFPGSLTVPEDSLAAIRFLERLVPEPLPSMWILDKSQFDGFFTTLIGCDSVLLGKKSSLKILTESHRPTLRLETTSQGQLNLTLNQPPAHGLSLASAKGRWQFDQRQLCFRPSLSPVLIQLEKGTVTLNRSEVPNFLDRELPSLSTLAEIQRCPQTEKIELIEKQPKIRAILDGTFTGLSCKLEAVYDSTVVSLVGPAKGTKEWSADPKNPLRYYSRSVTIENAARRTLQECGFSPGTKQPEFYVLSGEDSCLRFLANQFPDWRQKWEVRVEPRLQSLLSECDWIHPQAHFNSSEVEWLSLDISYRSTDGKVELSPGEIQQMLQTGRCSRRQKSGRTALIPTEIIEEWQETLQDCDEEAGMGSLKLRKEFAPYLLGSLKNRSDSWSPPTELTTPQPIDLASALKPVLRPYQRQGVEWMAYLSANGFGGILADEMGLGKTLQTLAYLEYRRRTNQASSPSLIVCPTSLLPNWMNECRRFTPSLKPLLWHGSERQDRAGEIDQTDLVVTSYALVRRDLEFFRTKNFDAVVLDEAQHIKNRFSQSAQAVKALSTSFRLILTGTPMENSLFDLWSMFDFLMPGYLGTATSFRDRYEVPITKTRDTQAQARLSRRLQPFVLRRTKQEVAPELPEKIETILWTELSDEQKGIYQQVLDAGRREIFDLSGKGDTGKRTIAMLTTLTRLRQVSCHLGLLPSDEKKAWEEPSAKLETFWETVEEAMDGGHRVLVFSQFVKMLHLLRDRLDGEKIAYCYLDGSTEDREGEVNRFQKDETVPVFLISLKAGGTGLNLTGADTVIHFDPWWNPAVEEQATARAHRIGQKQVVTSYKLIARGTVEEKILELQNKKRALLSQTVFNEQSLLQHLTSDEWQELLG